MVPCGRPVAQITREGHASFSHSYTASMTQHQRWKQATTDAFGAMVAWIASRPINRTMDRIAFTIFGQRAPDSKPFGWRPGNGGHGGPGGQTPPYVPYNPDWDPKNRTP
jgi:hypothetical protein